MIGAKVVVLEGYVERALIFYLYNKPLPFKSKAIELLNRAYGTSLNPVEIDKAIKEFKSKHPLIEIQDFWIKDIPLYGDEDNGLVVPIFDVNCIITLEQEAELMDIICRDPARQHVVQSLKLWFENFCHEYSYNYLENNKHGTECFCTSFLLQHGLDYWDLPVSEEKSKKELEQKEWEKKKNKDAQETGTVILVLLALFLLCVWLFSTLLDDDHVVAAGLFLFAAFGILALWMNVWWQHQSRWKK